MTRPRNALEYSGVLENSGIFASRWVTFTDNEVQRRDHLDPRPRCRWSSHAKTLVADFVCIFAREMTEWPIHSHRLDAVKIYERDTAFPDTGDALELSRNNQPAKMRKSPGARSGNRPSPLEDIDCSRR